MLDMIRSFKKICEICGITWLLRTSRQLRNSISIKNIIRLEIGVSSNELFCNFGSDY